MTCSWQPSHSHIERRDKMGQRSTTLSTEENRVLADSWRLKFTRSDCVEEAAPFSVLVIGEAGSGKSTLVNNLVRHEETEAPLRLSSTHETMDVKPVYDGELCEIPFRDSRRGRNEGHLHSGWSEYRTGRRFGPEAYGHPIGRGFHDSFPRDERHEEFRRFVEEDCLLFQYIQSIKHFLQKKKIDLIILCLKMPAARSMRGIPLHTSEAFGQIVMKAKRTVVALTFADCCSVGLGVAYSSTVQVDDFNRELDEWKHTMCQRVGVSQKVAKKIRVYPTSNDPSKRLPNNEPWLAPLVLGIREMLTSPKAIMYLKQHAALRKPKERSPSLDTRSDRQSSVSQSTKSATNSRKTATSADSPQNQTQSVKESLLSQNVYDHQDHLMLLRKHVSRKAASKGRAVLEVLLCDAAVIEACFKDNPLNEEEAVQAGIIKWMEGTGRQPLTWETLLKAMDFAGIARQHVQSLEKDLGLPKYVDT